MNSLRTFLSTPRPGSGRARLEMGLLALLLLAGCRFYSGWLWTESVPVCSYLNPDKALTTVGKVAIIELDNDSGYSQTSADVTEALFRAVQKRQIFSLTVVHQNDPAWQGLELDVDAYTLEQLSAIRQRLNCDAVLIGTITQYKPYPHIAIGLRMKLLDLRDGQLLWALEQVWDSADKTTQRQIKEYFQGQAFSGSESLREQMIVVSPLKFIGFVAYEVAETMQPKR